MKYRNSPTGYLLLFFFLLAVPENAMALQVHPAPEGLVGHQLAHAFFIGSMGIFIYWLEKTRMVEEKGWRKIQLGCGFLLLWNICAISGHILESRIAHDAFIGEGWKIQLVSSRFSHPILYYILHMDHLFCVPALILFLLGLKALKKGRSTRS
jgi:hypothetical protein